MIRYEGVWPAMLTPLDERGEPNLAQVEKLVELFVSQEMSGLYILGSTGQWPFLSVRQRQDVAERVIAAAAGRIPVIVHVGAAATDDAVQLARHAAAAGADGISSVAPIYYPASADVVFEHYRRIGAASDAPLMVYHLSIVNTLTLDARSYVDRLLALPHIVGMKYTDRDLFQLGLLHAHAGDRLKLFSGADELMCQAALSGACGAIGTFYNLWGPSCQAARRALVAGDFALARRFMLTFQKVLAALIEPGRYTTFMRSAMRMKYGIDIGQCKAPLGIADRPWDESEVERLVALVDDAAFAPQEESIHPTA